MLRYQIPSIACLLAACPYSPDLPAAEQQADPSTTSGRESDTSGDLAVTTSDASSGASTASTALTGSGTASESSSTSSEETTTATSSPPQFPPDKPVLKLAFAPIKRFDFSWSVVPEATHYRLLESLTPGEKSVLTDAIKGSSVSYSMPLHRRRGAEYTLEACNDAGCTPSDSLVVDDPMVGAIGYFKASNGGEGDKFGRVVALSADGNTLAVGAPWEDSKKSGSDVDSQADNSAESAGAVYIFVRDGQTEEWVQQAYIKASNPDPKDFFGNRVALSEDGSMLAVGAYGEASKSPGIGGDQLDNSSPDSGAVYVFIRQESQQGVQDWTQEAYIKASNPDPGDLFGARLALAADGTRLAVSAYAEDSSAWGTNLGPAEQANNLAPFAGAVYVFDRDAELKTWAQASYLKADNTDPGDEFGSSISISADGGVLVVGARNEAGEDEAALYAGAVYIYKPSGPGFGWGFTRRFKSSNTKAADNFGAGVALSGDGKTLAVSAPYESGIGHQSGAIHVFVADGPYWNEKAYLKPFVVENSMNFGGPAISYDGSLIVGGTTGERSNAVGVGGDTLDFSLNSAGAVYTFERSGETWLPGAYVKASNTDSKDRFGGAALSADGNTLAVGAEAEDSAAKGIGGEQADEFCPDAGAVYLY